MQGKSHGTSLIITDAKDEGSGCLPTIARLICTAIKHDGEREQRVGLERTVRFARLVAQHYTAGDQHLNAVSRTDTDLAQHHHFPSRAFLSTLSDDIVRIAHSLSGGLRCLPSGRTIVLLVPSTLDVHAQVGAHAHSSH